jgi:segregation and condensation protein A
LWGHFLETQIKLKQFEGPLDLLLYLVQKNEMTVDQIDLHEITHQYLEMIDALKDTHIDLISDFLLMAATLIKIKSDSLIPRDDENEEEEETFESIKTKEELQKRLEEYMKFKKMSEKLGNRPKLGEQVFPRPVDPPEVIRDHVLAPIELDSLINAFTDILARETRKAIRLKADKVNISDKILQFRSQLNLNEPTEFSSLLDPEKSGSDLVQEIVITFITVLELSRLGRCTIHQGDSLGPIYVELTKSLEHFDIKMMTGFDPEGGEGPHTGEEEPDEITGEGAQEGTDPKDSSSGPWLH